MLDPSIIVDTHQVPATGGLATGSQTELETLREQSRQADARIRQADAKAQRLSAALELQANLDGCPDVDAVASLAARGARISRPLGHDGCRPCARPSDPRRQ